MDNNNSEVELEIKNLTKFYILTLLKSRKEVSGYYILKRLEADLGKKASPTYVYDFLKNLKNKGYIEDVINPKSKRKKGFHLTEKGEEFINRVFTRFSNLIEAVIEANIKICASCGVKLYKDYYIEKIEGKDTYFCCSHCAKAYINELQKK
ncbi:MAG: PadR family transcriptional regulator [Promethearchaeia archaeon]